MFSISQDLGQSDVEDKKLYLVCQLVRIGTMKYETNKTYRRNQETLQKNDYKLKRPCGVAGKLNLSIFRYVHYVLLLFSS